MHIPSLLRSLRLFLLLALPLALLGSCASSRAYRQNIMFRSESSTQPDTSRLRSAVDQVQGSYRIRPNDYLEVRVYTNQGERLIDPNGELGFGMPGGAPAQGGAANTRSSRIPASTGRGPMQGTGTTPAATDYLVRADGTVMLPVVYQVRLAGYTPQQADSVLQIRYEEFYKGVFVQTRVTNNRIFVLGTPGGQIVPMLNENMNLLEVLATAGGIDGGGQLGGGGGGRSGKAYNIRLIRPAPNGDLKRAQVQIVDLSTIEGMRRANLRMQPNDVVYIEPLRRPFIEALNDASPVLGLASSLIGIFLLFATRN